MNSILFVTESLRSGGGVERNTVRLLTALSDARFDISLVSIKPSLAEERLQIPEPVPVMSLFKTNVRQAVRPLSSILSRVSPDIVYSGKTHVNVAVALANRIAGFSARHVASERVHLSTYAAYLTGAPKLKTWSILHLAQWAYRWVDRVVFVSSAALEDGRRLLALPPGKTCTIYNPIVGDALLSSAREDVDHPWFTNGERPIVLSAGRLSRQKGFAHLLRAFRTVVDRIPARLLILGEGPERDDLEALSQSLGIQDRVALVGFKSNPYKYMARADLFVLSSLWEGLPTVLVEAMACGTPVVASDCPSGPGEIITRVEEGILVPPADSDALANAILRVLSDPDLREAMRIAGQARAQDFRVEAIARQYEHLFEQVLSSR